MDQATRARLQELLDAVDAAAEGDSNDVEISAGFELAEYVRELMASEEGASPYPVSLRALVEEYHAASDGSAQGEIDSAIALAQHVSDLLDAESTGATLPTPAGKGSVHADALRAVLDVAERNDVTTDDQDAALRWAVSVAERPPLSPVTVGILHLIVQAAQKGYVVRRLGEDGHVMVGTARHLVTGPDDFRFPREDTDVRDTYLRVTLTGGVDVAWLVSDLVEDSMSTAFSALNATLVT